MVRFRCPRQRGNPDVVKRRSEPKGSVHKVKQLEADAEQAAAEHPDQVKAALAKIEGAADARTGGTHHDQIARAGEKAQAYLDRKNPPQA